MEFGFPVTIELLKYYQGGQVEISDPRVGYKYRGEIGLITEEVCQVRVGIRRLAKLVKSGCLKTWMKTEAKDQEIQTGGVRGSHTGDDRLTVIRIGTEQTWIFFPPGSHYLLDLDEIEKTLTTH